MEPKLVGESGVKPERRRTLERRIGARRGSREGGSCVEEKAMGMCARKGGRRSSTEGDGMSAIMAVSSGSVFRVGGSSAGWCRVYRIPAQLY